MEVLESGIRSTTQMAVSERNWALEDVFLGYRKGSMYV